MPTKTNAPTPLPTPDQSDEEIVAALLAMKPGPGEPSKSPGILRWLDQHAAELDLGRLKEITDRLYKSGSVEAITASSYKALSDRLKAADKMPDVAAKRLGAGVDDQDYDGDGRTDPSELKAFEAEKAKVAEQRAKELNLPVEEVRAELDADIINWSESIRQYTGNRAPSSSQIKQK